VSGPKPAAQFQRALDDGVGLPLRHAFRLFYVAVGRRYREHARGLARLDIDPRIAHEQAIGGLNLQSSTRRQQRGRVRFRVWGGVAADHASCTVGDSQRREQRFGVRSWLVGHHSPRYGALVEF